MKKFVRYALIVILGLILGSIVNEVVAQCHSYQKVEAKITLPVAGELKVVELRFRDKTLLSLMNSMTKNHLQEKIAQMSTPVRPQMVAPVDVNLSSNEQIKFSILEGLMDWEIKDSLQRLFRAEGLMPMGVCMQWTGDFGRPKPKKEKMDGN